VADVGARITQRKQRPQSSPEVSDAPARHIDIVPTILDALALPAPPELPGHSLRTRADRDGAAARASYFEAMESMLDFGFAPLDYISGSAAPKARYTERDDPKRLVEIDRMMHEAVALDGEGNLREGIALYQRILGKRPDMMAASRHLAFDYWRVGDGAAAIDALRAAVRAGPPTPGAQIQLATYLSEAGRSGAAIDLLQQAAKAEPTLDALNALGIAYARSGRPADALATFTRSLEIDPGNAMTFENIRSEERRVGKLADAKQAFERA